MAGRMNSDPPPSPPPSSFTSPLFPRRKKRSRGYDSDDADEITEGEGDATHRNSDGSDVNNSDHVGGSDVDTASADRSSGGGYASELSSELLNSLQHADDPLMQQLGSFLSASVSETADLCRRLAELGGEGQVQPNGTRL